MYWRIFGFFLDSNVSQLAIESSPGFFRSSFLFYRHRVLSSLDEQVQLGWLPGRSSRSSAILTVQMEAARVVRRVPQGLKGEFEAYLLEQGKFASESTL